jgi:hypothetical protein
VVALEWQHRFLLMHCNVPRQGHRQVVAQANLTLTLVKKVIHQLFIVTGLAGQISMYSRAACPGVRSVIGEHVAEDGNHLKAGSHQFRRIVAKPFQDLWFSIAHCT